MAHTQRELDWSSGFHAGKASGERGYRFRDDRAFRACVEALEKDKEEFETLLDGHVDDVSFAAVEQRLVAIRAALALAQEVTDA